MTLAQTIKFFQEAGIKAIPIPGTSKYYIQFRDGGSVFVGEKTLFHLLDSTEDREEVIRSLRNFPHRPGNYPERYRKRVTVV
ncbi:MAG: hypothetical protein IMW93_00620 [Thermoanaerobacteraceae bacterium]|uniref:Uncharacterized protein n=1 Tax=Desulfofundulus thermobenzoicus TaxID=29376 RepID=A0A6N7IND4_9FIRM|nr:hypothetical protein [Desulfofundulus thermobenzoicus]MBE3587059.1 hypothetical protein [Thermoanaerobacteraceae bacterium]MQL51109.1 hypothetical protein [Desulfofundulus thermobenzoicus]HHW44711.1 hypothetical protein [Desulfotomaculum sp.]